MELLTTYGRGLLKPDAVAFSRIDLLVVLGTLVFLGFLTLPLAAKLPAGTGKAVCNNNLRLLGRALDVWGADHGDQMPWWVPIKDGGTLRGTTLYPQTRAGNVFEEVYPLKDLVSSPGIFACPSDASARPATDFSLNTNGGFINPAFQNRATSYFLGLDVHPGAPVTWVAGDHNLQTKPGRKWCQSGVGNAIEPGPLAWTNKIHGFTGNILFSDGRVEEIPQARLPLVPPAALDNGSFHIISPR